MNKNIFLISVFLIFILLVTACQKNEILNLESTPMKEFEVIEVRYTMTDQHAIDRAIDSIGDENVQASVLGLVIPHHLLALDQIAKGWERIFSVKPDIVIVLAPNHGAVIDEPVFSLRESLSCFRGMMKTSGMVETLAENHMVKLDARIVSHEYGLTNLLPFIVHFYKNAELIPLVIARGTSRERLDQIVSMIQKHTKDKKVLWIGSVDFSHGLNATESRIYDTLTMRWIEKRDYNGIMSSTSAYMDNPSGLYMWLKCMSEVQLVAHGESGSITGDLLSIGTSYLIYLGK